jgi:hypothetical protein
LASAFTACSGGGKQQSQETSSAQKPNIVYILADDHGYGDLSFQGQKHFQTPNLDRMANEGMVFTLLFRICTKRRQPVVPICNWHLLARVL